MGKCCSIDCKRMFTVIITLIILVAGVLKAFGLIYGAFTKLGEISGFQLKLMWLGIVDAWILLAISIFGVIAGIRANKIIIGFYIGFNAISMAGCMLIFILCLQMTPVFIDDLNKACIGKSTVYPLMTALNQIYAPDLSNKFCTSDCPCATSTEKFDNPDYSDMVAVESGYHTVQHCDNYDTFYDGIQKPNRSAIMIMRHMEEFSNCSGLCLKEKYYYLSDVDKGIPEDSCKKRVIEYIKSGFGFAGIGAMVMLSLLLSGAISGVCLCCVDDDELELVRLRNNSMKVD